jgi:predicted ATPase
MRIQTITVTNFKSLVNFTLPLAKFSCLIGLNGAGKSTVLQFIDFLAQLVRGDINRWLAERSWKSRDLNSGLTPKKNIEFTIDVIDDTDRPYASWKASFNTNKLYCTSEQVSFGDVELDVQEGAYILGEPPPRSYNGGSVQKPSARGQPAQPPRGREKKKVEFSYEGSILSQLKEDGLSNPIIEFKRFFQDIRSFELLSPENLRQRTREAGDSIGRGGKRLSAFLHELGPEGRVRIASRLRKSYPQLETLGTKALRSGWKQLEIQEMFGGRKLVTEARHINDGMLRLIAILAELQDEHHPFLLFDEIENGINPELVEFVLDELVEAPQQVMVTTHSPLILNYLDDEVARSGVIYLYKTQAGSTRSIPFFSIPSLAEKLKVMGPGEAFADTDLTALADEITQVVSGGR